MGDGADDALDRAFDDEEDRYDCRGMSNAELYDRGHLEEDGSMPGGCAAFPYFNRLPRRRKSKASGAGPCPKCGGGTSLKKNSHGVYFYGCCNFPNCCGSRDYVGQTSQVMGTLSGDGECWCIEVTEEEYRRIVGEDLYQNELKFREEDFQDKWRIYPSDLIEAKDGQPVKLTITVEQL